MGTPAEAFSAFVNDSPGDRGYWADVFTALSSFGYCYVPIFIATMDFLITAISLNQRLQENIDPDFDPRDWSGKTNLKWFLFSMPSLMVTFLMLCFIPDLNS